MKPHEHSVFRFGDLTLVPSERLLLRAGAPVPLAGRAFDLLVALVRNAGHLITKDELLEEVWPGVVVEEVNLSVNISALRKALGQPAEGDGWIETVPRRGYRFNAPVEVGDVATTNLAEARGLSGGYRSDRPAEATPPQGAPRGRRYRTAGAAALAVAALAIAGLTLRAWLAPAGEPYPSVVVLPFSADVRASEYLADGVAEGVINGLARVRSLRVTPRASAFRFKGVAVDPIAAGRQLGTAVAVTGSLSQQGERMKVLVELTDVKSRSQVWGASYQVSAAELPGIHGRILDDLAKAMRLDPARAGSGGLSRPPTPNADAYRAYLQGRYHWNQRSEAALRDAVVHLSRAVELDPGFALAYAGLADAHAALGYLGYSAPVNTFPVARPFALKALELDPTLAEAHSSLGYIKFYFDWDWAGARREFQRAIELDPASPVSRQWHALYLLAAGNVAEGFEEIQAAQRLDPLSLAINTDVGFHHYYSGRYPEAIRQLQSVVTMKKDFLPAHLWLGRSYVALGRYDEALAELSVLEEKLGEWPVLVAARGFAYGTAGRKERARATLREMEDLSRKRFVTAYGVALIHAGLGERDEAFLWLEKAFAERSHWLVWLRLDTRWANLRGDPRFAGLVERLKYPG